jgi:uncharacterized protein (TIGR00369 family)
MNPLRAVDPDFERRVRASFGRQRFMALLGARLESLAPGRCVVRLAVRPDLAQQHGYVHAGVTSAIADSAAGYAAYSLFPADSSVLTVEFKINLLAPADAEELIARAQVIRTGRMVTVVHTDVHGLKAGVEKHVAAMQATMICLHDTPDAPATRS